MYMYNYLKINSTHKFGTHKDEYYSNQIITLYPKIIKEERTDLHCNNVLW